MIMKKVTNLFILPVICIVSLFAASCDKEAVQDITKPYEGAQFKVYNFVYVRNLTPAPTTNTVTFNAYANNVRFATVVSTSGIESANALTMGNLSPARGYSLAPAGNIVLSAKSSTNAVANAIYGFGPNLEIASVAATVENAKNYSFYVCGEFNKTTQKADGFVIEDKLPQPDTGFAYIRLVNPAPNTSTLTLDATRTYKVDGVDVVDTSTPITGVAYKTGSDFVKVTPGSYTLKCTDVATGKFVNRTTVTSLQRNRVYTFTVRGDLVGAVSFPAVFLDFTENR